MAQTAFSPEWLQQFSDPYAILGLSVTADDRRVLKRYRSVAKLLHPDMYISSDSETQELASQVLARIVNPAYQKLKQEKGRAEMAANLRFRVRRALRDEVLSPKGEKARRLMQTPPQALEMIYEQAIAELAEMQYQDLSQFESVTVQLGELNLVYLQLKMGEPMIREKRSGLVPSAEAKTIQFTPITPNDSPPVTNYAQRHFQRAVEYMKKQNWTTAVQELRDAIKLDATNADFHSHLAKAYLMQNLSGMAKVHFRQALKLDPKNALALKYVETLNIKLDSPNTGGDRTTTNPRNSTSAKNPKSNPNGLFGLFARKN
jgi:curved DNA-binding protein CbpA